MVTSFYSMTTKHWTCVKVRTYNYKGTRLQSFYSIIFYKAVSKEFLQLLTSNALNLLSSKCNAYILLPRVQGPSELCKHSHKLMWELMKRGTEAVKQAKCGCDSRATGLFLCSTSIKVNSIIIWFGRMAVLSYLLNLLKTLYSPLNWISRNNNV